MLELVLPENNSQGGRDASSRMSDHIPFYHSVCLPLTAGHDLHRGSHSFPFHGSPEKSSNQPEVTQHPSLVPATVGVAGNQLAASTPGPVLATLLTQISSDPDGSLGGRLCDPCDMEEKAGRLRGGETERLRHWLSTAVSWLSILSTRAPQTRSWPQPMLAGKVFPSQGRLDGPSAPFPLLFSWLLRADSQTAG